MNSFLKITVTGLIFFFSCSFLIAQPSNHILPDKSTTDIVKIALDHTYNFEFEESKTYCEQIRKRYPMHPGPDFIMALNLYWEMFYNDSFKEKSPQMLAYLTHSIELSKKMLTYDEKDVEGVFFKLANECYLALYYSERDETSSSIGYARKMYSSLKVAMTLKDKLNEFYFPTGVYNYYVVMYPEVHPVFKPFMFMFMDGDKALGLKEMDYAWKNAVFCKMECGYHLCNIYLKYEGKPLLAYPYTKALYEKYPGNIFFALRHAEALIAKGDYKEAEKIAHILYKSDKKYFVSASFVLYGLLYENYFKEPETASMFFQKAIQKFQETANPEKDYLSMAYAGMGRYYKQAGNKQKATEYYKKCRDIAEYVIVAKEADLYLSNKK
ncbi:MAG TPA: tetratricopeptide repeat protein [Cytophagaceae bacterium]|nr:tetratricopeptide repeat protein [Cytophagaceae bacterium]